MSTLIESEPLSPEEIEEVTQASRTLAKLGDAPIHLMIQENRETIELPAQAVRLLASILTDLSLGRQVVISPREQLLTTQQAAAMLNVSRPFVSRQLKDGRLRFTQVGTHRRIRVDDLMVFRGQMRRESDAAMGRLAELENQAGMED